ncbi:hypothetical protein F751_0687 [Auxenochlorella protothecoides]|uniref:Uncharacterized protein n=1 Tax=Auxenochlorella protothecoides TaxID=3075 RepID=A0A087SQJ7_AUXPR|nr:hypothetical protein F751_0687 [Auxenochlorella protothecoides]KFM28001.1 hypothetical protein F751_0687 [Auxenochlorella protothecoides]
MVCMRTACSCHNWSALLHGTLGAGQHVTLPYTYNHSHLALFDEPVIHVEARDDLVVTITLGPRRHGVHQPLCEKTRAGQLSYAGPGGATTQQRQTGMTNRS